MARSKKARIFRRFQSALPGEPTTPPKDPPIRKKGRESATVTLKDLAAAVADEHEMTKKQSEAILNSMIDVVAMHLKKGDRIRIGGLGILVVRKRAARMARNPATGKPFRVKAKKKVAFRAAKELKESI